MRKSVDCAVGWVVLFLSCSVRVLIFGVVEYECPLLGCCWFL